jgi:hypothetical protein
MAAGYYAESPVRFDHIKMNQDIRLGNGGQRPGKAVNADFQEGRPPI